MTPLAEYRMFFTYTKTTYNISEKYDTTTNNTEMAYDVVGLFRKRGFLLKETLLPRRN